jgi:hypothetical protein
LLPVKQTPFLPSTQGIDGALAFLHPGRDHDTFRRTQSQGDGKQDVPNFGLQLL